MISLVSRLPCLGFVVQFGAVLMRHRGHNGHNGQYLPLKWDFVDAVLLCGHNGHIAF